MFLKRLEIQEKVLDSFWGNAIAIINNLDLKSDE
jgi:hypothetical protein